MNAFRELIDLCSDPTSRAEDINKSFANLHDKQKQPELENTIIICYEKLLAIEEGVIQFDLLSSAYSIEALIKNERYDLIQMYFMQCKYYTATVPSYNVKYMLKYSKWSMFRLFMSDLVQYANKWEDDRNSINHNNMKQELFTTVKTTLLYYSSYYDCSIGSDIAALSSDWLPSYPSQDYFRHLLEGACNKNRLETVKNIISDFKCNISSNIIRHCMCSTTSLDIIKLLHGYKPVLWVTLFFFNEVLFVRKRLDVIEWMIDNNISIQLKYSTQCINDYIEIILQHCSETANILLYFIINKKLKVKKCHLLRSSWDLDYLLLLHYYVLEDYDCLDFKFIRPDAIDAYLSLYPTTYDKEKMKHIRTYNHEYIYYDHIEMLTKTIPAIKYIEQYFILRQEFHEELQLLFDLPLDLCKQIL
jgi:hypothetical protein